MVDFSSIDLGLNVVILELELDARLSRRENGGDGNERFGLEGPSFHEGVFVSSLSLVTCITFY